MSIAVTTRRLLLVFVLLIGTGSAVAEPYFAVQQGLKCVSCHVNPTGGGMRNAFGNAWAQAAMPARQLDVGMKKPWTGSVSRYLALGSNLRANANYVDTPNAASQSEFELQEARLYLELAAIPDRLSIYLDQRVAPGSSENLEAYGRYWSAKHTWYVKAGQMYLPYGIRLEDDSAFIREVPGINFTTPDRGVEAGIETTHWSAQLAITNGTASGPETDTGKQYSTRVEYVRSVWRIGASANYNDADAAKRTLGAVFAGLRTGPIAWLAEADYVADDTSTQSSTGSNRKQWVGLLEANWLVRQGQNIKLTAEYFDPDDDVDENERARYSAVWEYTPMQFLQIRAGARVYDGIPQIDVDNRKLAFAQINVFF